MKLLQIALLVPFVLSGVTHAQSRQYATTWAQVAPIISRRCAECHFEGDSTAPFPLVTFEQVRDRAKQIVEVTQSRYMPPWLPAKSDFDFAHDRSMSAEEVATLASWLKGATPKGDVPAAVNRERSSTEWRLGEPDVVLSVDKGYDLAADGREVFWNFVFPVNVVNTRHVDAVELKPESPAVHHMVGMVDRTGAARRHGGPGQGFEGMEFGRAEIPASPSMLWSPGKVTAEPQDGVSWSVDSQTDIVLQMHLFPTGKRELVRPQIGLYFADQPPTAHPVSITLEAASIDIPPGKTVEISDEIRLPVGVELLSIYPHAHYLGKHVTCRIFWPDGHESTLIQIPDWDFNWQDEYVLAKPLRLPSGTVLKMSWSYDNTPANIRNPNDPPRQVTLGNNSTDEMGTVLFQVLCKDLSDREKLDESCWLQKLKSLPDHTTANQNLGNLYESRGELHKARKHYERVVNASPRDSMAHDNLASTLAAIGDEERAEHHFRRAIALDPDNALAHNNWGAALMRSGRIAEAVTKIERAIEIWPQFPEARVNLGEAELRRGDSVAAEKHFRMAATQSPGYALAHFNLATVLMNGQRFVEAEACFRDAIKAHGKFAAAYNNLGICLFQQDKLDAAAQNFRRSIEIDPEYVNPRQNLKVVESKLDNAK